MFCVFCLVLMVIKTQRLLTASLPLPIMWGWGMGSLKGNYGGYNTSVKNHVGHNEMEGTEVAHQLTSPWLEEDLPDRKGE